MNIDKNKTMYEREVRYDAVFFRKFPITLVDGKGTTVRDANGREYIDCTSSYGVMGVGYSNVTVQKRIATQLERMTTCHQIFCNDLRGDYFEALIRVAPEGMDKVYLCNSGTEAVEAAIKVAIATTGRTKIIACTGAYHGLTLGATGLASNEDLRSPFKSIIHQADFIKFGDIDSLESAINEDTALFIVELVQASNGGSVASHEFVKAARELTTKNGTIMAVDEVCTGFCRTGEWFATQQYGIVPDCITIAKSFGGGLPLGALLMKDKLAVAFPKRLHHNTFGGNPIVMAAGLGAIEFAESTRLWEQARKNGKRLSDHFTTIPQITKIQGMGLLIGIEFDTNSEELTKLLMERHQVLVIPRLNDILFMPPLVISEDEVDRVGSAVRKALSDLN
jgi:LysW-gamma-L-lysine/LysW-L-ornithine aminotransferase